MTAGRPPLRGWVAAAAAVAMAALVPASASAAFTTVMQVDGTLVVTGDGGDDSVTLTCVGSPGQGSLRVNAFDDPTSGPASCPSLERVTATMGDGENTLNLIDIYDRNVGSFSGFSFVGGRGFDNVLAPDLPNPAVGFDPRGEVFLGPGHDTAHMGGGSDVVAAGSGTDEISGSLGADLLLGEVGADVIYGGSDGDRLLGGAGRDGIDGGSGPDTLLGNGQRDVLIGDTGKDRLRGGPGRDQEFQGGKKLRLADFF